MMDWRSKPVSHRQVVGPEMLIGAIRDAHLEPCQLSAGPAPSLLQRVNFPRLCLDLMQVGPALWVRGAMPVQAYTLVHVLRCPRPGRSLNFGVEHSDGYMGVFAPGGDLDAVTPASYGAASLTVPVELLRKEAEALFPELPAAILEHGAGLRVGMTEHHRLAGLLGVVSRLIADPAFPLANTATLRRLEDDLLEIFLEGVFSGSRNLATRSGTRVARRFGRLRQAQAFLVERCPGEVSLGELCREVAISRRGLECLFEDCLGLSPAAFVRHQRLHGVRGALRAASPAAGMVKAIALEWGFWHLGRFARDYRALFGESPRETLGLHRNTGAD